MSSQGSATQQLRYPFWFGGSASCMAACVTHPLDLSELMYAFGNYYTDLVHQSK